MKSEVVTDNKMINRLKVVLAEKNRTGKWLAQQLGKNEATVRRTAQIEKTIDKRIE